ncbi:MAG: APC family permease [Armatimonadaceae bacterium]
MTETVPITQTEDRKYSPFQRWLLAGYLTEMEGPHEKEGTHKTHPWWQVMCLTGVDYFSTLGYQPGIAALAAGALSPLATLVLVALTLFGALPIYRWVARESPHGEGSIAILARQLSAWKGKLLVLILLGFLATDFIITITLSSADAAAHIVENPYVKHWVEGHEVAITLTLIAFLAVVFLKGFKEAIGIAVVLVAVYLTLNAVVIGRGVIEALNHPDYMSNWLGALTSGRWVTTIPGDEDGPNMFARWRGTDSIWLVVAASLLLFPKLALGLSGFETGVAVMPLVQGDPEDTYQHPRGRIRNTRKLLTTAAIIMSCFLISSSFVTTLTIPPEEFLEGGKANGRALAFLAYRFFGNGFGTLYDISTILILWFAGASAMAGLLNVVPRYLPRYGMAPEWTRATRPLVFAFTIIAFAVTIIFRANVDAQGGAYATGVLVLMTADSFGVMLLAKRLMHARIAQGRQAMIGFAIILSIFAYTTIVNVIERPDGIKIAAFFIISIVLFSLISRIVRTTELRTDTIQLDDAAQQFIAEASEYGELRIIASNPERGDADEYRRRTREARLHHMIPPTEPLLFMEVFVEDASDFSGMTRVRGYEVEGYRVLRVEGVAIPNAIAALLLHLRDRTGKRPHAYFSWTEGNPFVFLVKYLLLGQGDVAPVTHEVLRVAEPNPEKRPAIHVGF